MKHLDIITENTKRLMGNYGPDAIYMQYASGNAGRVAERAWMAGLTIYGGYLSFYDL